MKVKELIKQLKGYENFEILPIKMIMIDSSSYGMTPIDMKFMGIGDIKHSNKELQFEIDDTQVCNVINRLYKCDNKISLPCEIGKYVYTIYRNKPSRCKVVGVWISTYECSELHLERYDKNGNFKGSFGQLFKDENKYWFLNKSRCEEEIIRIKSRKKL